MAKYKFPKGHKINIGNKFWLGRKHKESTKKKIGKANKGNKKGFQKGHPLYSDKGCFKKGNRPWNWKGGKSMIYRVKHSPRPKPDKCEICKEGGRICYDHDHKTGEFRGWICEKCNLTLGFSKENYTRLLLVAEYIAKWQK